MQIAGGLRARQAAREGRTSINKCYARASPRADRVLARDDRRIRSPVGDGTGAGALGRYGDDCQYVVDSHVPRLFCTQANVHGTIRPSKLDVAIRPADVGW